MLQRCGRIVVEKKRSCHFLYKVCFWICHFAINFDLVLKIWSIKPKSSENDSKSNEWTSVSMDTRTSGREKFPVTVGNFPCPWEPGHSRGNSLPCDAVFLYHVLVPPWPSCFTVFWWMYAFNQSLCKAPLIAFSFSPKILLSKIIMKCTKALIISAGEI